MKPVIIQIIATRRDLLKYGPRSRRRIELEVRLRDLVLKQLRAEMKSK